MNYNAIRRATRTVTVGRVAIGGTNPIAIQSMTNTDTHDVAATIEQIKALAAAGCDIVRLTVPDLEAAETIRIIKERVPMYHLSLTGLQEGLKYLIRAK